MRFQTFLFLLLTLSAIDIIAAGRFSSSRGSSSRGYSSRGYSSRGSSSRGSSSSHTSGSSSSHTSGSYGSNSHGSSGSKAPTPVHHTPTSSGSLTSKTSASHSSPGDRTQHQQSTHFNTNFLNAERGGATRPAGKPDSKPGTVTESKQSTSRYQPSAPTETRSGQGSNTHYGPWSNPHFGTNQQKAPSQTQRPIGFKNYVYPSPIPPVHQSSSMPMRNPYSLHPPENIHGASGPTYYPQQPQMFAQPAMQPFVPGQTVLIMQQDSGRGVGEIVKEALIHSTINAAVKRVINPHTHYVESGPASSPASTTHITYNNHYFNTPPGTDSTAGGSVPQGTIPGNNPSTTNNGGGAAVNGGDATVSTGTSTSRHTIVHNHYHHNHHHATQSNQTATNKTNSPAGPSIVDNSSSKISDNDIFKITEELFAMSLDISKYIQLDLQIRSTSPNATDEAKKPLFKIDPILLNYPSIYITHTLYDKYGHDSRDTVNRTQEIREHENLLIDTYLNTNVMATAMKWLGDQGFIDPDDFEKKDVLRRIWFTIFSGSTCGFERIFESENDGLGVIGVQDWLYFVNRESARRIDYMSYVDQLKLGTTASLLKLNFAMDGIVRPNATIFVGTMPELEMALYTICFYARSNDICPIALGGTRFDIYTHSFMYFGNLVLDFGRPMI